MSAINGACGVQGRFLAQHIAFEKPGRETSRPQTLSGGDNLVLHDGGCCAKVEQVNRAARNIGQVAGQLPKHNGVGIYR
jgi:hypothetical protein